MENDNPLLTDEVLDRLLLDVKSYDEVYLAELWGPFDYETSMRIMRLAYELEQMGIEHVSARRIAEEMYREIFLVFGMTGEEILNLQVSLT